MAFDRRTFVGLSGAAAAAAVVGAVGGAADAAAVDVDEVDADEVDDPPAHARWLTTDEEGAVGFAYLDWARFDELQAEAGDAPADEPGEELERPGEDPEDVVPPDPMLAYPSIGLEMVAVVAGTELTTYGLEGLVAPEDDEFDAETDLETTIEAFLLAPSVLVVEGAMAVDELDERLTRTRPELYARRVEPTDEIGSYEVYTDDETAVAVGEGALVVTLEPADVDASVEAVARAIEAREGDAERAIEASADFAWLAGAAGHGDIAVGIYREPGPIAEGSTLGVEPEPEPDPPDLVEYPELADATGFSASLTYADVATATGDFAAVHPDPDEAALEQLLGASAVERSLDVEDDRVTATAEWRGN